VTAVYEQAGVIYDSLAYTYAGWGPGDKPVVTVELNQGGYIYEDDYAYEFDAGYGVQIAALDPFPAWTDITETVSTIRIRRGSNNFLIRQPEGASATIIFDDPDSRFLPTNTSSPYFGDIKPSKGIRVVANWSDSETVLFRGLTQKWQQNFRPAEENTEVVLTCSDFTQLLYNWDIDMTSIGASGDFTGTRIGQILDDTGPNGLRGAWPPSLRSVATGIKQIEQDAAEIKTVLDALKLTIDSEWGLGFVAKDGTYIFLNQIDANPGIGGLADPDYYFGEDDSVTIGVDTFPAGRYDQIETQSDDDTLANVVEVTDAFGNIGGWKYTEAIGEFEERVLAVDTLLQNASSAESLGTFILQGQYQPLLRIRRLGFYGSTSVVATRAAVLSEIVDEVFVRNVAPGGITIDFFGTVAEIEHEISRDFWYTTFTFSPGEFDPFASTVGEAL